MQSSTFKPSILSILIADLIKDARHCAAESGASVFNACEVLDKIKPVFVDACEGSTEKFDERQDSHEKLNEYEGLQDQRQSQLREFNVEAADQLQDRSIGCLGAWCVDRCMHFVHPPMPSLRFMVMRHI